jgi:hypothetical protein
MDVKATESPKPPYGPFRTFWNFIEQLRENGPLPQLLDRSQMGKRGGSARSELYMALRFFGLIDDRKAPTQALQELVDDHPDTKKLRSLVEDRYGQVIALNLTTATPKQVDEKLTDMGAMPSTVQRSRLFFLNALETVGIDIGNPLKNAPRSAPRKRTARKPKKAAEQAETPATPATPDRSLPTIVEGLVERLPANGEDWNAKDAEEWLALARPALAFSYGFNYEKQEAS